MKKLIVPGLIIAAVVTTAFFPRMMLNPGKLIQGHQEIKDRCLACHSIFKGLSDAKCTGCHPLTGIGKDSLREPSAEKVLFHHKLSGYSCTNCHTDHAGLVQDAVLTKFTHDFLSSADLENCSGCHRPPDDKLHRQIKASCATCHSTDRWSPATFDHSDYFPLDSDHNARCAVCHTGNNYSTYSCYGCHEHSPSGMRNKHAEEGIYENLDQCVRCHKSPDEHGREGGEKHRNHREEHDEDD